MKDGKGVIYILVYITLILASYSGSPNCFFTSLWFFLGLGNNRGVLSKYRQVILWNVFAQSVNAAKTFACKNVLWNVWVQTKIRRHRLARLVLGLALLKKGTEENCSDPLIPPCTEILKLFFCVSEYLSPRTMETAIIFGMQWACEVLTSNQGEDINKFHYRNWCSRNYVCLVA